MKDLKEIISAHFDKILEMAVLLFIFVFGAAMLARFPSDELARWIEGGAVIGILARAVGQRATPPQPDAKPPIVDDKEIP